MKKAIPLMTVIWYTCFCNILLNSLWASDISNEYLSSQPIIKICSDEEQIFSTLFLAAPNAAEAIFPFAPPTTSFALLDGNPPIAVGSTNSPPSSPMCEGQDLTFEGVASSGGTGVLRCAWENPDGFTSDTTAANCVNFTISNAISAQSGDYILHVKDEANCVGVETIAVLVQNVQGTATSNGPVCQGGTLVLTGSGGVRYDWTYPGGSFGVNDQNPVTISNVTLASSGTFTVTITDNAGCQGITTVDIVVHPNPTATVDADANVDQDTIPACSGGALQFSANGGAYYEWTGPNGYTSTDQNPLINPVDATHNGLYQVVVMDSFGTDACRDTAWVLGQVNPIIDFPIDTAVCIGDTIWLTANLANNNDSLMVWTGITNGFNSSVLDTFDIAPNTVNFNDPDTLTYQIRVTDQDDCTDSTTINIYVFPNPTINDDTMHVCINDTIRLNGTNLTIASTGSNSYQWHKPLGTPYAQSADTIDLAPATIATNPDTLYYAVILTDTLGGVVCRDTALVTTIVHLPATVDLLNAVNDTIWACIDDTLFLNAGGNTITDSIAAYAWTGPDGFNTDTTFANKDTLRAVTTAAMTGKYYVIGVDTLGCTSMDSVIVMVTPSISLALTDTILQDTITACIGDTVDLRVFGQPNYIYHWDFPINTLYATAQDTVAVMPNNITFGNQDTLTYFAITEFMGCTDTASLTILVQRPPTIIILNQTAVDTIQVCEEDTLFLSALSIDSISTYAWSGPNGFSTNSAYANRDTFIVTVTQAQEGEYVVTATDTNNCMVRDTVLVEVGTIPNATAFSNSPVCSGDDIALIGGGGGSGAAYRWLGPIDPNTGTSYTSNLQTPIIPSTPAGMDSIYRVIVTNAAGCSDTAWTTISYAPALEIIADSLVCVGDTIHLMARDTLAANSSFAWTIASGLDPLTATNDTTFAIAPTVIGAQDTIYYEVEVTDNNGCQRMDSVGVVVVAAPTVTVINDTMLCVGSSIALDTLSTIAANGLSFMWTGPNGFMSTKLDTTVLIPDLSWSGNYILTITDTVTNCTGATDTVAITGHQISAVASHNNDLCSGDTIRLDTLAILSTISPHRYSFGWQKGNPATAYTSSSLSNDTVDVHTVSDGDADTLTYILTVRDTLYTTNPPVVCSTQDTIEVLVHPNLMATHTSDTTVCHGENVYLWAAGGDSIRWENGPGGFNMIQADSLWSSENVVDDSTYVFPIRVFNTITGCFVSDTVRVTVAETPTALIHPSTTTEVCQGDTIHFILGSNHNGSHRWINPNNAQNTDSVWTIFPAQTFHSGTYSLVVDSAGSCQDTVTMELTVRPLPELTSIGDTSICQGEDIDLWVEGADVYAWRDPQNGMFATNNDTLFLTNVQPIAQGQYMVIGTDTIAQCVDTTYFNLTVHLPQNAITPDTLWSCIGDTVQLAANNSGSDTYQWSGPSGFASTDQNPESNSYALTGGSVYTYYVTVTNPATCVYTDSVKINIATLPNIGFNVQNRDTTICGADTLRLIASGGDTYNWTGPAGFTSTLANPMTNTNVLTGDSTYLYLVEVTNTTTTCQHRDTVWVTINELPTITLSSDTALCVGDSLGLWAVGGLTYNWSGPNGATGTNDTLLVSHHLDTLDTGWYYVTVTNANNCSDVDSVEVTINVPPTAMVANDSLWVCAGDSISLSGSGGVLYAWTGPNGFATTTPDTTFVSTGLVAGIHDYQLVVRNGASCTDTSHTYVTIYMPLTATTKEDTLVCFGVDLELEVMVTDTITGGTRHYQWTGPNGFNETISNPVITNIEVADTGWYQVVVTDSIHNTACRDTARTHVLLGPITDIDSNSPICEGDTIELYANGGHEYDWTGPNAWGASVQNPTILNADIGDHSGWYYVTVIDTINNCSMVDSVEVDVNTGLIAIAGSNSAVCGGEDILLFALPNSPPIYTYQWEGPNGFTSTVSNPVIPNATMTHVGEYFLTITDPNGCYDDVMVDVVVHPVLDIETNMPVCAGDSLGLQVNVSGGSGDYTYEWSGPNAWTANIANPSILNLTTADAGTYTVIVTDHIDGCVNQRSVEIDITARQRPVCIPIQIQKTN